MKTNKKMIAALIAVLALVMFFALAVVVGLVAILAAALILPADLALIAALIALSALVMVVFLKDTMEKLEKYSNLLLVLMSIGLVLGGIIGYQQVQANALQSNTITITANCKGTTTCTIATTIPQSYYEGTVQAISMNAPGFLSYVQFTSEQKEYGNLSAIANLSIGADCRLFLNQSNQDGFISGACK